MTATLTARAPAAPMIDTLLLGQAGAVLLAAGLLVWPAFLNGYPLLFVDSAAYFRHLLDGAAPWDKTAAYGPFLALFDQGITLWGPLGAQGLILSVLLWLTQHLALGRVTSRGHLLLATGLAALTAQPWFSATLMPDFFTPVVVLCLYVLGFGEARLGRWTLAGVALLGTLAIAVHLSHLPTACALVLLVGLLRRQWGPLLRTALPIAAALVLLLGANWHAFGRPTLSAHGAVFLLARLQDDGPAVATLRDRCPQMPAAARWHLCGFLDRLPMDSDLFLWTPESPVNRNPDGTHRLTGNERLAPEAGAIVGATLRAYPLQVAQAMAGNTLTQLFRAWVGDTHDAADLGAFPEDILPRGFPPRELRAFLDGAQWRGDLEALAAPFLRPHAPVLVLSAVLALAGWWRLAAGGDRQRLGFVLCVLVALAGNAFATGALSKPHARYQARIVWLLPMAAALAFWPRGAALPGPGAHLLDRRDPG
jgi:hypothetical protein